MENNNKIIDGKKVGAALLKKIKMEVADLKKKSIHPSFKIILVGHDPASLAYIKQKLKYCEKAGIKAELDHFEEKEISTEALQEIIQKYNVDAKIHGILVQLPLPTHIDSDKVLRSINTSKDVDGFTSPNLGEMFLGAHNEDLVPCTPQGVIKLLEFYNIEVEGKEVVIVGRSNTAGKPMAVMLINRSATVTVCHSKTRDLNFHTLRADILIVAVGKPKMIKTSMVKEGAVIIDIGINRLEDGTICGDVDFDEVEKKASFITPVPGGVGRMTVICLLENIIRACHKQGLN